MRAIKDIIDRKKKAIKIMKDFDIAKVEMKAEWNELLKQYNLKVYKLKHLEEVNPLSDEIDVLQKEIEANFLRLNNLHREIREKHNELELKSIQANEKAKIFKRKLK